MERIHYIITWIYYSVMASCAIWAAIKYIEPLKYIKYHSLNKFLKLYINLGKFVKISTEENNYTGDYSVYFETIKNGLWKEVLIIRKINIKTDERKIEKYISQIEKSSLFIIYNDGITVIRLNAIL